MTRSVNAQRIVPCMPPLMEEETIPLNREDGDTKFGGTACENIVKAYFLSKSINIAEPNVDDGVDLLIEKKEKGWVRGQVKKVVYQNHLDNGMYKKYGKKIYRSRFNFSFQGGGRTAHHLKNGRRQRKPEEIDFFYHVLSTCYRQLIWETPAHLIPLREDGTFIMTKNPCLDRNNWKRKPADIDFNKYLVYKQYDPIVFENNEEFFLKEKITLDSYWT